MVQKLRWERALESFQLTGRMGDGGGARRRKETAARHGCPMEVNGPRSGASRHGERGLKAGVFLAGAVPQALDDDFTLCKKTTAVSDFLGFFHNL
jgi:hypothetical protein